MSSKLGTVIADFTTQLASAMGVGATTATLQSATDDDGNALPNGVYFFAIDGNNSQKEHVVCTLTGTSLTNIKSVSRQGVQSSGCIRSHRVGSTVSLTDFAHLRYINDLLSGATGLDGSNPLGYDTTPTLTTQNQLATKGYVDNVAISGGADASSTLKGITKLSVNPVTGTNPIAVGDNDTRVPTASQAAALVGTSGTAPSGSNKFVDNADTGTSGAGKVLRLDGSGKIPALDASSVTGSPALNGANFTNVPGAGIVLGSITQIAVTAAGNNDTPITTTFTPRLIRLHYWIQGHDSSAQTNAYFAEKGLAVYNGATLQFVVRDWALGALIDNQTPTTVPSNISPDSVTAPTAGITTSSSGGAIQITLSIVSVSSTGFTIRSATTINGTNGNTARARIAYEAFA